MSIRLVEEAGDYTGAITGLHVDAARIGCNAAPTRVADVAGDRVSVTRCEIGFPMATHSHIPDHQIVVAFMLEAGQQSRWCAVPLRSGTVMIYGPGSEHIAVNQPGLRFTFGVADLEQVAEVADRSGRRLGVQSHGSVQQLPISATTRAIGDALCRFTEAGLTGWPLEPAYQQMLRSLVRLLATDEPRREVGGGAGIDSRKIVRTSIEYVTATERIPSMQELCDAASVSERRLRSAFTDQFGRPPSRFFRAWALGLANCRLREAGPGELTVTEVAMDLGFGHLGRFAGHYRQLYGEPPSATLRGPSRLAS